MASASPPQLKSFSDPKAVESTCQEYGLTSAEFKELHERCVAAKSTAYCPYSQFRVGASIISVDGVFFNGANVENASYPVGTCAERVALGKAVTEGHRKIKAVAVATDISPPASPCKLPCQPVDRLFFLKTSIGEADFACKDTCFTMSRNIISQRT